MTGQLCEHLIPADECRIVGCTSKGLLTPAEVARLLRVAPKTLRDWARQGRIASVTVGTRGDRRFRRADVEAFLDGPLPVVEIEQPARRLATARQLQVLAGYLRSGSRKEAAGALGIQDRTAKEHLTRLYARLGVGNAIEAARVLGWLKIPVLRVRHAARSAPEPGPTPGTGVIPADAGSPLSGAERDRSGAEPAA